MDSDKDYAVAKEIVQSGQSDEDWDNLRLGKGAWPEDERKGWKQYRKYSMDKLQEMMESYKKPNGAHGAVPPARRSSPSYLKEVYVLGIRPSAQPNSVQALELLGTTFAITTTTLLTACHVLRDEESGADLVGELVICRKVVKRGGALTMVSPIRVRIVDMDLAADFAILKLDDPVVHSFSAFIPLCSAADLPDVSLENEELKSYHAPIGQFLTNAFVEMSIWAGNYHRVLQYDRNGDVVLVDCGLYRGSCGAPYINHSGQVVGMHLSSMHEGRNVSLVKKRKRVVGGSVPASTLGDVIDSVTDIADVHASIREGLVLCKQPRILQEVTIVP